MIILQLTHYTPVGQIPFNLCFINLCTIKIYIENTRFFHMNSIIFSRFYEFQAYNWSARGNMQITKNPTETATESVEFDFLNFYCFIAIFSPSFHFTQQHLRVVMRFVLCFSYFEYILIWMVRTTRTRYFMMISELETQSESEWPALFSIVFLLDTKFPLGKGNFSFGNEFVFFFHWKRICQEKRSIRKFRHVRTSFERLESSLFENKWNWTFLGNVENVQWALSHDQSGSKPFFKKPAVPGKKASSNFTWKAPHFIWQRLFISTLSNSLFYPIVCFFHRLSWRLLNLKLCLHSFFQELFSNVFLQFCTWIASSSSCKFQNFKNILLGNPNRVDFMVFHFHRISISQTVRFVLT